MNLGDLFRTDLFWIAFVCVDCAVAGYLAGVYFESRRWSKMVEAEHRKMMKTPLPGIPAPSATKPIIP